MMCLVHADLLLLKEEFSRTAETAKEALGKMSGEIVNKYFRNYHCITVVTEMSNSNPTEIFDNIPINTVPTMHIHFSRNAQRTSEFNAMSRSTKPSQLSFEELLLLTLDQRCLGYIIQASDLEFMVDSFNRLTRKASQRINRQYVYLPTLSDVSISSLEKWDESILNVFPLRSLDFMPDFVVARYETHRKITQDTFNNKLHPHKSQMTRRKDKFASTHISSNPNLGTGLFATDNYKNNNVPEISRVKSDELSFLQTEVNDSCTTESRRVPLQNSKCKYELISSGRQHNSTFRRNNNLHVKRSLTNEYPFTTTAATSEADATGGFSFQLITHKYRGTDGAEPVLLDTWVSNKGFLQGSNLFPDKLHHLMGKPFYVTTLPYPPFVVLDIVSEPPVHDGFEFRIVKEFVRKHQMKIVGVYDLDNWWGEIWENGSGNGLSGLVAEDKADVAFAAVYLWVDEYRFTDYRYSHIRYKSASRPLVLALVILAVIVAVAVCGQLYQWLKISLRLAQPVFKLPTLCPDTRTQGSGVLWCSGLGS